MDSAQEVVITGVGVISPIGIGKDAFWQSLHAGQSGVRPIPAFAETPFPVKFGGNIPDFDGKLYIQPRKSMKVMCREIQLGFSAATLAVNDCGLTQGQADPERFGVVFGAEMFYGEIQDVENAYLSTIDNGKFEFDKWGPKGIPQMFPLWMLKYLPNMAACHVGIAQDARGPNNSITLGEASGLLAVIEATSVIQRGQADIMIVGGVGSRINLTPMLYRGDANLSHYQGDPSKACRPFETSRDGMVNGEGACAFILENRQHAEARGAKILGRIMGFGSTFESRPNCGPSQGIAMANALRACLRSAGIQPSDVDHVNAHGISKVVDDRMEAQAIESIFAKTPVTALKSFFGNLGAGSGLVEMAASLYGLEKGEIPFTLNYDQPDATCPINLVHGEMQKSTKPIAIKVSESGTGQAAAVAFTVA